jgi:hypothetical protein
VSHLQDHVQRNLMFIGFMPFLGIGSLAAMLPLFLYVAFPSEFPNLRSPLHPSDYRLLMRRMLSAARGNNMKVTAKDL